MKGERQRHGLRPEHRSEVHLRAFAVPVVGRLSLKRLGTMFANKAHMEAVEDVESDERSSNLPYPHSSYAPTRSSPEEKRVQRRQGALGPKPKL